MDLLRIAVHEAGHAVAAAALRGPGSVRAIRMLGSSGYHTELILPERSPLGLLAIAAGGAASALVGSIDDGDASDRADFRSGVLEWAALRLYTRFRAVQPTAFAHSLGMLLEMVERDFWAAAEALIAPRAGEVECLAKLIVASRFPTDLALSDFAPVLARVAPLGPAEQIPVLGRGYLGSRWDSILRVV